ncbi:hypothetical protein CHS0354_030063 [Potamilus streckersoni]|uniref:leucine--tRNA ligase n=1 Tax=Potamilus streckersoni TaxID=2493646 RepID=A0AAE0VET6_9BIVA|nr:hypothetical protein CHS0354_030063 [Potamilus streckersoni]
MPYPLDESELPLRLPETENYRPSEDGESPLSNLKDWLQVTRGDKNYRRETNTMPQWAGSCWYYLRFTDPHNTEQAWSKEAEKYWMPVDLYVGGAEHAVLHLLYARFWHKVLYDLGYVSTPEPFTKLVNQGIILGPDGQKMSKSAGNVVNPDDVVASHGADSLRRAPHSNTGDMSLGPKYDPAYLKVSEVVIPVQINGKLRDQLTVASGISQEKSPALALEQEKIQKQMNGKTAHQSYIYTG